MRHFLIALMLGLWTALPVHAEISGAQAPAFTAALEIWLTGDDAAALPAFAELAAQDNRAAQIWLGVLASATWTHAHVTKDMPRKERNTLLRAPGGLSGKSWVSVAADHVPLAAHLRTFTQPYSDADTAEAFLDAGEYRFFLREIGKARNAGRTQEVYLLASRKDALPLTEGYLAHLAADIAAGNKLLISEDVMHAAHENISQVQRVFYPVRSEPRMVQRDSHAEALSAEGEMLAAHPMIAPVAAALTSVCPDEAFAELSVLQSMMNFYPIALFAQSPLGSIMPHDTYLQSPRFARDLRAEIALNVPGEEQLAEFLPCVARLPVAQ